MDPAANMNALLYAFVTQHPGVLDLEGAFHPLVDAVIDASQGEHNQGSAVRWARAFLAQNRQQLEDFAGIRTAWSPERNCRWFIDIAAAKQLRQRPEHRIAASLHLPPLPDSVEFNVRERYVYDTAVVEGLNKIGLRLRELWPEPRTCQFTSIWVGADGGRIKIRERCGLPIEIRVQDGPNDHSDRRTAMLIAGDPERVAHAVIRSVQALWV